MEQGRKSPNGTRVSRIGMKFAHPLKTLYFQHCMIAPEKILIIRLSSIGDILLAAPLVRVLRARFPSSHIDFLVRKEYAELVRYNKNLNRIVEFDTKTGISGLCKLKKQLRAEHYDLVLDIHNSLRSRYLRMLLGVEYIAVINKRIFARTMLVKFKKNYYRGFVSVADRYIETVNKFGVRNDNAGLELHIPDEIKSRVAMRMAASGIDRSKKIMGVCPSAKHTTKCWPQERFAELGIRLANDYGAKIILFGGPADKERCGAITNAINKKYGKVCVVDLSGELSLLETAAAMECCTLVVTNDSGLMHIASAMKRKVAAIFGSTVREFGFFPVGTESMVVERTGLYCRPCSPIGRSTCPEGHFRCMNEIQVEDVAGAIKGMLVSL
jgi:lipopolysaccharide heptosyltransferase II